MEAHIDLAQKTRKEVGKILNNLLSDEFLLYIKTLKYHWNVHGMVFHDFHALFKEQYEALLEFADDVAERARALDEPAFGSMAEFSKHTRLKEEPGKIPDAHGMIKQLLSDHETIIRQIRKDIETTAKLGDMGTNNFLTELMEKHEKIAWMLRATAQK
jgi:starvation-inducible DNA-binding protein